MAGIPDLGTLLKSAGFRQLSFLVGVTLSVALGIYLYTAIQQPVYAPLNYKITQQNMSSVIDTLEQADIQYHMGDHDGVVMVPANDLDAAKLKLSAAGVQHDDGASYAFLNDQGVLANSQFMENARYLRALEADLARTISHIQGITSANVHIAMPQNQIFADEKQQVTASVVLSMSPGLVSDHEKIRSIMQIVADSVPGLDPNNVAVTDQYGHFLSDNLMNGNLYNMEQLNYQNDVQGYYEKRINAILTPIIGANHVNVRVNANIDFTQQENAQEQYDPNARVLRSQQTMTSSSGGSAGASGVPGALSNTPPSGGSDAGAAKSGGGSQQNQMTQNYDVSRTVTYKKQNFAQVKSLSVAVVVDNMQVPDPKTGKLTLQPVSADMLAKITDLVKATMGFNAARGDTVTVINSNYSPAPAEVALPPVKIWNQVWFWSMVQKSAGILFGFVLLVFFYRRISRFLVEAAKPLQVSAESRRLGGPGMDPSMVQVKEEGMTRLKQLASEEPTRVAHVIKGWVNK